MSILPANEQNLKNALAEGRALHICVDLRAEFYSHAVAPFFQNVANLQKDLADKNIPTIWLNHTHRPENSYNLKTEFIYARPQNSDFMLNIPNIDAWGNDTLQFLLRAQQADTVLLTGHKSSAMSITLAANAASNGITAFVLPEAMCHADSTDTDSFNFWKPLCETIPLQGAKERIKESPSRPTKFGL